VGQGGGAVAQRRDLLQRVALVGGETADGLDEVGDEVVATVQLDVDLAPGLLDEVAALDEAVVRADAPDDGDQSDDNDDGEDGEDDVHARSPKWNRSRPRVTGRTAQSP